MNEEKIKYHLIDSCDGNDLLLLEDCNVTCGLTPEKIKNYFKDFDVTTETLANTYIIRNSDGEFIYE